MRAAGGGGGAGSISKGATFCAPHPAGASSTPVHAVRPRRPGRGGRFREGPQGSGRPFARRRRTGCPHAPEEDDMATRYAEALEPRRLFAVVTPTGIPGFYDVQGTNGDDTISIAINQPAGTFILDGATYGGVQHVNVRAGLGNDSVSVSSTGVGFIAASIHGEGGNDSLTLNGNGAVFGEDGNDT